MQASSSSNPAPAALQNDGKRLNTKTNPSETSYPAASSGPTGKRQSKKKLTTLKQLMGKYITKL